MFEIATTPKHLRREGGITVPPDLAQLHRVACSLSKEALESVRSLGNNPRSDTPPADEAHVRWSLEALSVSPTCELKDLRERVGILHSALEETKKSPASTLPEADYTRMMQALDEAFRFLRWPQNRERLAFLLGTAVNPAGGGDNPATPVRVGLFHRLFGLFGPRRKRA
jgi:hypothetical protein